MSQTISDRIAAGKLAKRGLLSPAQVARAAEVVAEVEASGLETIRVVFPDQHGLLRGKNVTARTLASIFASGLSVPSTVLLKDTANRTVFDIWDGNMTLDGRPLTGAGDILLVPDPDCLTPLPWSPHSAILMCDLAHSTGRSVTISSREVLRRAIDHLSGAALSAVMGLEVEFQVFAIEDDALDHEQATFPPAAMRTRNLTQGWSYLSETRYGEVEGLLDTLRRHAEAMGLSPRSMEIEMGPSQFEFTFDASDPLTQADRFVLFRTMVKEVCQAEGLHASFMAKPRVANSAANGWHIHQSLVCDDTGANVFMPTEDGTLTDTASHWVAGLLDHAAACCLMTNPTVNGYKRFTEFQLAPNRVQWGTDNRGAMLRALLYADDPASRVENRVADTTANPYYALAAQIIAGLDGLSRKAKAPPPTATPYGTDQALLPPSLIAAIEAFEESTLFNDALGPYFVRYLTHLKRAEWQRYLMTVSDWEQTEYFNLF